MKRFLTCVSLLAVLWCSGCARDPYRKFFPRQASAPSALRMKPDISRELYRCTVDGKFLFKKFHLSGVLLFKQMDDGSVRAVFQNEMGVAFFDFEWDEQDSFMVKSVLDQLNRPAVINTLRTDLNLLLMKGLNKEQEVLLVHGTDTVYRFPVNTGHAYYVQKAGQLSGIDYRGGRSRVTSIFLSDYTQPRKLPDSIQIVHHKANFRISLRKLGQNEH